MRQQRKSEAELHKQQIKKSPMHLRPSNLLTKLLSTQNQTYIRRIQTKESISKVYDRQKLLKIFSTELNFANSVKSIPDPVRAKCL